MIFDVDSRICSLMERILDHKHPILVFIISFFIGCISVNLGTAAYAIAFPEERATWFLSSPTTRMYVRMSSFAFFDRFFFLAGLYTSLLVLFVWTSLLTHCRKLGHFLLKFEHNWKAYRESLLSINDIRAFMKRELPLLARLPVDLSLPVYHYRRLKTQRRVFVDMRLFEVTSTGLPIFSASTLLKTAVMTDLIKLVSNLIGLTVGYGIVHSIAFLYYLGFDDPINFLLVNTMLVWFSYTLLMFCGKNMIVELYAILVHMSEINGIFRVYTQVHNIRYLRRYMFWHVMTSVLIDKTDWSAILFAWFYYLLPVNAYLLFRLVRIQASIQFQLVTALFFIADCIVVLVSFRNLVFIHKSFYVNRNSLPAVIGEMWQARNIDILFKLKVHGVYEQQVADGHETGFKIAPDTLVNARTFMTFMIFYFVIILEVFKFFNFSFKPSQMLRSI